MKKVLFLSGIFLMISACKKESTPDNTGVLLKSITYTNPTNSLANKTYTIFRNSSELIDSMVITGADASAYRHYSFFHTAGKLDSIMLFNAAGFIQTAKATWSGNNLLAFWVLSYTYDSEQRITQKLYQDGSFFRVEHFSDSSVYNYDAAGADPEYKSYVQYYNKAVKNPFRLFKYENAYPISNFIFNAFSSDFTGMYNFVLGDYSLYNTAGLRSQTGTYIYSGNFKGYPTGVQQTANSTINYTLNFTYE